MIFETPPTPPSPLRRAMRAMVRADETETVQALLTEAAIAPAARKRITARARELVERVRAERIGKGGLDAFLGEYQLSSEEGIALMCLAEALLRIPDAETADRLIKDKIGSADWKRHLGNSESLFVNASTWGLMLTGRILRLDTRETGELAETLGRLVARSGEPFIRQAMTQAMRILGRQFVMARTVGDALDRAAEAEARGYRHSFDMLGEAAHTAADAERYYEAYEQAIADIGKTVHGRDLATAPGVSVKLSALHPRYEFAQTARVLKELTPRVVELAARAKAAGIGFCVDAEEADRLEPSLDVFAAASADPRLAGWDGFGLVVQTYLKSAPAQIDWLADLARRDGRRLMVRLVKGAYWDSEIKRAQQLGLDRYPVFTRKESTDVSFIACAKRLIADAEAFYPQFATHNALTLATVLDLMGKRTDFEFQRLHGMGEALYDEIVSSGDGVPCRIYAPVGSHEDLLPYLVRRLLENGSNTSFVNRIVDEALPVDDLVRSPVTRVKKFAVIPHPRIPLPADLFGAERRNSGGLDLADPAQLAPLAEAMDAAAARDWHAAPLIGGEAAADGPANEVRSPADTRVVAGTVVEAGAEHVDAALARAQAAWPDWERTPAEDRAACLERMADALEAHRAELMALCVREAGKSVPDALGEVREAVDFCRYYAVRCRDEFAGPRQMPGPTGEDNALSLHGRGVFATISPWNFPLAIFTGMLSAALAAGNAVIAKPAEQTPLTAAHAVRLFHGAGVPGDVLHLLPGRGEVVGARLAADPRVAGVAFTGSTETAQAINRALAARDGPIAPLIAETGGQNALIADSSALVEQVVSDAVTSAFNSAGQRCSALRVLFVQEDVAPRLIAMLAGAMAELTVGDPALLATDVGPVIDAEARDMLEAHAKRMKRAGTLIYEAPLPEAAAHGTFVAPKAFEIESLSLLTREVFGPILHVIRYPAEGLDAVIEAVNATGYGLTLGIHSRIDDTVDYIRARVRVGNTYVNRNMIGAVVGVQPFGGEGLSGTGPKAGGPHYLHRFAVERSVSVDTTAAGGNAALMTLEEG